MSVTISNHTKLDDDWTLIKYVVDTSGRELRFYVDHSCGGWTSHWVTGASKRPYTCARCDSVLPKQFQMVVRLLTMQGVG